jgi:D-aminopeptidase
VDLARSRLPIIDKRLSWNGIKLLLSRLLINGEVASEYTLNALCAARYGVPSAFLSGDAGMCADAKVLVPAIGT